jgi:hypothetical protein
MRGPDDDLPDRRGTSTMSNAAKNANLNSARYGRDDEFYTRIEDIERELLHYRSHFEGKVVYLNCDDPFESNFFKYFAMSFNHLGLKKLVAVSYAGSEIVGRQLPLFEIEGLRDEPPPKEPYLVEITEVPDRDGDGATDLNDIEDLLRNDGNVVTKLAGDGDFRSDESVQLLKQADIVVTNPPFSLFREFIGQLVEHSKKFVIVGSQNAITYREVWPLLQAGEVWLGVNSGDMAFRVPDDSPPRATRYWEDSDGTKWRSLGNACWFTNLDHSRRHEEIPLYRRYEETPDAYPRYNNFDAIEVGRVAHIPTDFDGVMGVPVTFLSKHNPDQFELVGMSCYGQVPDQHKVAHRVGHYRPYVAEKAVYQRIFVRRAG